MVATLKTAEQTDAERDFRLALEQFQGLLPQAAINGMQPMGPATVYTALVTVWLLVYQRLQAGTTLMDAVAELVQTSPDYLPKNRRVREQTLSSNTGAYSRARTRLNPQVTPWLASHIYDKLVAASPPSLMDRRAFILDGTTIPLAPTKALQAAFPPASNQHGASVWPIAHWLVAHELESGCAILPEIGAMYGPQAESEIDLTKKILRRLPAKSIVLADRNFGVFAVAHAAVQSGHYLLFRLTQPRFKALLRRAKPLASEGQGQRRWQLTWKPSKKDRKSHPELAADASVEAILHEVVISPTLTLWLVTTLPCTCTMLADLYGRRQDVETDIRNLKVTLNTEQIQAKSVDTLHKEIAASIIAYNLVIQIRRLAAKRVGVKPRRLSFTGTWSAVRIILLAPMSWDADKWCQQFALTLRVAGQRKLPNRPGRHFPRKAHTRRNKSTTQYKKQSPPDTK